MIWQIISNMNSLEIEYRVVCPMMSLRAYSMKRADYTSQKS